MFHVYLFEKLEVKLKFHYVLENLKIEAEDEDNNIDIISDNN